MCERWIFTVPREMNIRSPISGFVSPPAAWRTISSSVGVRLSQPADGRYSLEGMARDLKAVLDATSGGRPVVLVGHSIAQTSGQSAMVR